MKPETLNTIKKEISYLDEQKLKEIVLRLAKHKLENKELLSYLLFDAHDEDAFVDNIKEYITEFIKESNRSHIYYVKKAFRKALRMIKKYIRFSKKPETEAALLIHFCLTMKEEFPTYSRYAVLRNVYNKQLEMAKKAIGKLHEDLQYDFQADLDSLI